MLQCRSAIVVCNVEIRIVYKLERDIFNRLFV